MAKIKARQLDTGTGANQVVELDGSSKLPAVDGSALTNLPSAGAWDIETIKSSNTSRINTTTLAFDNDFTMALEANSVYQIALMVRYNTDASSPDISYAINYSGTRVNGGSGLSFSVTGAATSTVRIMLLGSTANDTSVTSSHTTMHIDGMIETLSAGNFTFAWAQRILDAVNNTNVYRGSFARAKKLL